VAPPSPFDKGRGTEGEGFFLKATEGGQGGKRKLRRVGWFSPPTSHLVQQPHPLNPPLLVRRGGNREKRGRSPLLDTPFISFPLWKRGTKGDFIRYTPSLSLSINYSLHLLNTPVELSSRYRIYPGVSTNTSVPLPAFETSDKSPPRRRTRSRIPIKPSLP